MVADLELHHHVSPAVVVVVFVIGGGVAASRPLRAALADALGEGELYFPSPRLATDNAAMIARAGAFRLERGDTAGLDFTARADLPFPGLQRA